MLKDINIIFAIRILQIIWKSYLSSYKSLVSYSRKNFVFLTTHLTADCCMIKPFLLGVVPICICSSFRLSISRTEHLKSYSVCFRVCLNMYLCSVWTTDIPFSLRICQTIFAMLKYQFSITEGSKR